MICELETITPVHIGTGARYNKAEFVVENNILHRISVKKLLGRLSENEIEVLLSQMERGGFSIGNFLQHTDIKLDDISVYSFECQMMPDQIREQIKTGNVAYLPGSTIKGAVRSALLYWYIKNNDWMIPISYLKRGVSVGHTDLNLLDLLGGEAQYFSDGTEVPIKPLFKDKEDEKKKRVGSRFIDLVFAVKPFVFKNNKPVYNRDAKYDLLKFLHVSDFMPTNARVCAANLKTYSLKHRNLEAKSYDTVVEAVHGRFSGTLSLSSQIYAALEYADEYPLLMDRLKILGLEDDFHDGEVMKHLKIAFKNYNSWCIKNEIKLVSFADNGNRFIGALEELERLNTNSNLIRVGFGVGTMYQTLIKLIEEEDVQLAEKIVNEFKLGKFRRNINRMTGTNLFLPYPKTIEFSSHVTPLGWLGWK